MEAWKGPFSFSPSRSTHFPTHISDMATEGTGQGRTYQGTESKSGPLGGLSLRAEAETNGRIDSMARAGGLNNACSAELHPGHAPVAATHLPFF